jgi:signal transduction histidine kinase
MRVVPASFFLPMHGKYPEDLRLAALPSSRFFHLDLKHVDLSQIVTAAVDAVQHAAQAKQIALELSIVRSSAILVKGDMDRLQQIVWNLLSNAGEVYA